MTMTQAEIVQGIEQALDQARAEEHSRRGTRGSKDAVWVGIVSGLERALRIAQGKAATETAEDVWARLDVREQR